MPAEIIKFERFITLTNPSFRDIEQKVRDMGWKAFQAHFERLFTDGVVVLKRLPG